MNRSWSRDSNHEMIRTHHQPRGPTARAPRAPWLTPSDSGCHPRKTLLPGACASSFEELVGSRSRCMDFKSYPGCNTVAIETMEKSMGKIDGFEAIKSQQKKPNRIWKIRGKSDIRHVNPCDWDDFLVLWGDTPNQVMVDDVATIATMYHLLLVLQPSSLHCKSKSNKAT